MTAGEWSAQEMLDNVWAWLVDATQSLVARFQDDQQFHSAVFIFLLGIAVGWFLRSLLSPGKPSVAVGESSSGDVARTRAGKTREEVELDARRRL